MRRLLAVGLTVVAVVLLGLIGQVVLPGLAADHIRDEIGSSGRSVNVKVTAFPAWELVLHRADAVTISMGRFTSSTRRIETLLRQAKDTGKLHASADLLRDGPLTVRSATLIKRGEVLDATADVSDADLDAAAGGIIDDVTPVSSGNGQLVLRGTFAGLVQLDATVEASAGRLLLVPDVLHGGFAQVTLLNDPHLDITGISAQHASNGFVVHMTAKLR